MSNVLNKYYFVQDGIVFQQFDLYELAYDYQIELLGGNQDRLHYREVRDETNPDVVIRDFGHPTVTLHYSEKFHNKKY